MSRESHFNSVLNNSEAAEFFKACAAVFGCLAWETARVKMLSMGRMNSPGVCTSQDLGDYGWKLFRKALKANIV